MILKRWACLALALWALAAPALAEAFEGRTAALATVTVLSEQSGDVESVGVIAGQRVEAGETLAQLRADRTFASQDGAVCLVSAQPGDDVAGTVLALAPIERYALYCTVDDAYPSAASTLLHCGETLYAKCTADGSHRAVGIVTRIDGEEYRVLTTGGELYVGETVCLYRDADFTAAGRVGVGTVVTADTEVYEADGVLARLCVSEGDDVERGQLLFEIGGGDVTAPAGGIVASVSCRPGDALQRDQAVAEIVPDGAVGVEISVDETAVARIAVGDAARVTLAGQEEEDAIAATVVDVFAMAGDGQYTVRLRPDAGEALPLGMSVAVRIE